MSDRLTSGEHRAVSLISGIVRRAMTEREHRDGELSIAASVAPDEYRIFMSAARRLNLVHLSLEAALSALESADTCMLRRAA